MEQTKVIQEVVSLEVFKLNHAENLFHLSQNVYHAT